MSKLRDRVLKNLKRNMGELRYWWSGDDVPVIVNNKSYWRPRVSYTEVQPAFPSIKLYKGSADGGQLYDENSQCYSFLNDNEYGMTEASAEYYKITLGHHFRFEFDIDLDCDKNNSTFVDFGSVGNSSYAIGFGISKSYGMNINWKMLGNNSNPGTRIAEFSDSIPQSGINRLKGYFLIKDGGDGYDRFVGNINGETKVCSVQIPKVSYGPDWIKQLYFGRGLSSGYKAYVNIYDLKFYVID